MADLEDARQGLLGADHGVGDQAQHPEPVGAIDGGSTTPGVAAAPSTRQPVQEPGMDGSDADSEASLGPERSLLSQAGSITGLPRRPVPPPRPRSTLRFCCKTSAWFTMTLLLGVLTALGLVVVLFPPAPGGGIPSCRSGAAIAVLPGAAGSGAMQPPRVLVWSGRAQSGAMLRGSNAFNLTDLEWTKVKDKGWDGSPGDSARKQHQRGEQEQPSMQPAAQAADSGMPHRQHSQGQQQHRDGESSMHGAASTWWLHKRRPRPPPPPVPAARWKAGAALVEGVGMLVFGGDVPAPARKGQPAVSNSTGDVWLLSLPRLAWQQGCACVADGQGGCTEAGPDGAPAPRPRRSHSLVSFQDEEGRPSVMLFGGRRDDGLLLNDVWSGVVYQRGNFSCHFGIAWTLLHDPQAGVGEGPSPLPRSGHVAVVRNSTAMVMHGGSSEVYGGFSDVWSFSLPARRWQPLPPARAVQPAPRDHHGAALWNGQLFIFGGRFGSTGGGPSYPIGDRWLFDLEARSWRQLPVRGLSPLPRFLFSYAQYAPASGGADAFLVFGGETGSRCKLNDVWSLSLDTYHWQKLSDPAFDTSHCRRLFG